MTENLKEFERNIQQSFSYVKKDLLMLNDAIAELHDKIQQLSLRFNNLAAEVESLKKSSKKSKKK